MKNRIYLFIVGIGLAGFLSSCAAANAQDQDSAETLAQYNSALEFYNQIEIGMSYEAALALTDVKGESGEVQATTQAEYGESGNVPLPPGYLWRFGENGGRVTYYFLTNPASDPTGGKFFSWPMTGLTIRKDAITTQTKFDQVNVGMTYEEVAAILGSAGRLAMAHYLVMQDKLVMTESGKGFPVASVTTKVKEWAVYYWWVDATRISTDLFSITFTDGVVSEKLEN